MIRVASRDSKMVFQRLQTSVLVFTVCLVLVITSAGNFKVSAAAQQFEAQTLEGGCPATQDDFERVKRIIEQDIGPLIEKLSEPVTQSPTTGETTEQSTPTTTEPLYICNATPGWRQVVFINMTDTSYNCPPGLNLTTYSKRTCGRARSDSGNCSSTTFSVGGSEYSRVCGRIRGYQVGVTVAFTGYIFDSQSIDGYYVDGVSLTHGAVGGRQHIWTFGSGLSEVVDDLFRVIPRERCPCDQGIVSPPFVGNDYFCESGFHSPWNWSWGIVLFPNDPLWDGQGCTSNSTCCQFNNPPWFTKNLPNPTTDDIELRLCLFYDATYSDALLELIELYVQ